MVADGTLLNIVTLIWSNLETTLLTTQPTQNQHQSLNPTSEIHSHTHIPYQIGSNDEAFVEMAIILRQSLFVRKKYPYILGLHVEST